MLKGLYSAAAGMVSQMVQTDTTAHNLANISTIGFKRNSVEFKTFGDAIMKRLAQGEHKTVGRYAQGSQAYQHFTVFTQGDVNRTGNTLDLAIRGDGFFTVKTPEPQNMEMYTRNGRFTIDKDGFLADENGNRVQGINGDIQIPIGAKQISVLQDGDVVVDNIPLGTLKIAKFANNQTLQRIDNSLYSSAIPPAEAEDVQVVQGFLEQSNTNPIAELTNNIVGLRIYEALQQSIKMQDRTLDKAINEVGKVR